MLSVRTEVSRLQSCTNIAPFAALSLSGLFPLLTLAAIRRNTSALKTALPQPVNFLAFSFLLPIL